MSQNLNNFTYDTAKNPVGAYENTSMYSRSHSPGRHDYSQAWSSAPGWPSVPAFPFGVGMPFQDQVGNHSAYIQNHQQELTGYDENDDFYDEEPNTMMDIDQVPAKPTLQASQKQELVLISTPNNPLEAPRTIDATTLQSSQSELGSTSNTPSRQETNDRLAELRAKVVAARRGKSTTPVPTAASTNIHNVDRNTMSNKLSRGPSQVLGALEPKTTDAHQLGRGMSTASNKTTYKSLITPQTLPNASVANADIEGLFAEARAAEAAKSMDTSNKTKSGGQQDLKPGPISKGESRKTTERRVHKPSDRSSSNESTESGEISSDSAPPIQAVPPKQVTKIRDGPQEVKSKASHSKSQNGQDNHPKTYVDTKMANAIQPTSDDTSPAPPKASNIHSERQPISTPVTARDPQLPSKQIQSQIRAAPLSISSKDGDRVGAKDNDRGRPQASNWTANDPDRDKAKAQNGPETRRTRADREREENERAAAQYKRELEDRAKQREPPRTAALDQARMAKNGNTAGSDSVPQNPKAVQVSPHQEADTNSGTVNGARHRTTNEVSLSLRPGSREYRDDVADWLEITGYYDFEYREKSLQRFRRIKELQRQQAELEREAQREFQTRRPFMRSISMMPLESIETNPTPASPLFRSAQPLSAQEMRPPPLPPKDDSDDVGIKIKNTANRDASYTGTRAMEDVTYNGSHHATGTRYIQSPNKSTRAEPRGRLFDTSRPTSPVAIQHDVSSSYASRKVRDDYAQSYRIRSRSPRFRRRSASPSNRRFSDADAYTMQSSRSQRGGSMDRHIELSRPEHDIYDTRRDSAHNRCRNCDRVGHYTPDCPMNVRGGGYRGTSADIDYRDSIHPYKRYDEPNGYESHSFTDHRSHQGGSYRGRGRGGRGNYNSLTRNGFKPSKTYGGKPNGTAGGSESLDLKAGGCRYFVIKSFTAQNVVAAQRDCIWATQPKNLEIFTEAFNGCRHVILIFSVNNSRAFQGYSKMLSLPSADIPAPEWQSRLLWQSTHPFRIEWITIAETRFHRVAHLKNALNEGQMVLVGKDGQEIEAECGRSLCELIDEEALEHKRHKDGN
ncbi:MAG: hypothetical protein Q9214_001218 [Letrouitia sp. 1 TL-2023]